MFAQDMKLDVSGEEIPYDTSHIYTGEIYGETVLIKQVVSVSFSITKAVMQLPVFCYFSGFSDSLNFCPSGFQVRRVP